MTLYSRQWSRPSPRKKCKKAKWLSEEALQIAEKRREAKGKGKKETHNLYVLLNSNFFVLNIFSIPFTLWYSEFPVNLPKPCSGMHYFLHEVSLDSCKHMYVITSPSSFYFSIYNTDNETSLRGRKHVLLLFITPKPKTHVHMNINTLNKYVYHPNAALASIHFSHPYSITEASVLGWMLAPKNGMSVPNLCNL